MKNIKWDAMLNHPTNTSKTYFFKGDKYDRYDWRKHHVDVGYSKSMSNWEGIPSNIDAALNHPSNTSKVYFFRNKQYYRYNWKLDKIDDGYPKSMSLWKGVPDDIDGALNHPTNSNKVYFFKNSQYYRYNWRLDKIDDGYPKRMSLWKGVPNEIDGALNHPTDPNKVYFFKGGQYYRYNWRLSRIDRGYPKSIDKNWKGLCDSFTVFSNDELNYLFRPYGLTVAKNYLNAKTAFKRCKVLKEQAFLGASKVKYVALILRVSGHSNKEIVKAIYEVYPYIEVTIPNPFGTNFTIEVDLLDNHGALGRILKEAGFSVREVTDIFVDVICLAPDLTHELLDAIGFSDNDIRNTFNSIGDEFMEHVDSGFNIIENGVDNFKDSFNSWF